MCCASQLSGTRQVIGLGRVREIAASVALALVVTMSAATPGLAQVPTPAASPTPTPSPTPTSITYDRSVGNSALDLGSNFLERLGNQASNGFNRTFRTNPGGGGACCSA